MIFINSFSLSSIIRLYELNIITSVYKSMVLQIDHTDVFKFRGVGSYTGRPAGRQERAGSLAVT